MHAAKLKTDSSLHGDHHSAAPNTSWRWLAAKVRAACMTPTYCCLKGFAVFCCPARIERGVRAAHMTASGKRSGGRSARGGRAGDSGAEAAGRRVLCKTTQRSLERTLRSDMAPVEPGRRRSAALLESTPKPQPRALLPRILFPTDLSLECFCLEFCTRRMPGSSAAQCDRFSLIPARGELGRARKRLRRPPLQELEHLGHLPSVLAAMAPDELADRWLQEGAIRRQLAPPARPHPALHG